MGEAAETFHTNLPVEPPQELFDLSMLPDRSDLVEMVKERSFLSSDEEKKRFRHTGKIVIRRLLNDEELCVGICTAIVCNVSARLIGMRYHISPKSVVSIRRAMEDRGELAAVRTRITRLVDEVTEVGLETVLDGLLAGQIPAGSAWIPALATLDKREQLSVGIVPGTDRTRASVTVEQVLAEHAAARLALGASDSESGAQAAQRAALQAPSSLPSLPATVPATANATLDLAPAATTPAPRPATSAGAREPGGGIASAPPPLDARGVTPENFTP